MKEFWVRLFHWVWGRRVSLHLDVIVFRSPSSFLLSALQLSHLWLPLWFLFMQIHHWGKKKIGSWAGLIIVTVEPNFFIYSFISVMYSG